jgi:hypothetical protein
MKIDKGRTLSQFVDYLYKELELKNSWIGIYTILYNEKLKQKPVKEMFVNEVEKPPCYIQPYQRAHKAYKEAEKKVIFPGFEVIRNDEKGLILNKDNKCEILIRDHGIYINTGDDCFYESIKTIEEFFIKAGIELEIQNVEI